ncbi:MAG TPA: hypothetical protein VD973_00480 [Symbiobacteriaceae bacterium]|jgi:hypothetical protein|nr:hypothetical protein [Symbiobacteriaceae bacterium]
MTKVLLYVVAGIIGVHGLIHLMGFVAYWPLGVVAELPYKTTVAGGAWDVGALGMKVFGVLWLIVALGFVAAVGGFFFGQSWWRPLLVGTSLVSTAIIAMDWAPAFRGAYVNVAILMLVWLSTRLSAVASH